MGKLLVKAGVDFGSSLAPAGAQILGALKAIVSGYPYDITITSSRDGRHSGGATGPHGMGEAFDIRTRNLTLARKQQLVKDLQLCLGARFFTFLEAPGTANEHIHCQRKRNTTYSIQDYLRDA